MMQHAFKSDVLLMQNHEDYCTHDNITRCPDMQKGMDSSDGGANNEFYVKNWKVEDKAKYKQHDVNKNNIFMEEKDRCPRPRDMHRSHIMSLLERILDRRKLKEDGAIWIKWGKTWFLERKNENWWDVKSCKTCREPTGSGYVRKARECDTCFYGHHEDIK